MSQLGKKSDEMLITHVPAAEKDKAGRDENARARGPNTEDLDRASLAAELAAAQTEDQRRKIIQSIQELFGNEVAEEIIGEARNARLPNEETNDGGPA